VAQVIAQHTGVAQQSAIRDCCCFGLVLAGAQAFEGTFLTEPPPQQAPDQADQRKDDEVGPPAVVQADPGDHRPGDQQPHGTASVQQRHRQVAPVVGEPLVQRMGGDRRGRPLTDTQQYAAGDDGPQ